jgi:trans-aconitate 2-methyltransferase
MADWNPSIYLKFKNERTQPSIDLAARIAVDSPATIVDLGCGPGNSTKILADKWPNAQITGIDNSVEMLTKAKADYPAISWVNADIATLPGSNKFDVVFSNATLQWLKRHETLIPQLFHLTNQSGALAVQVPANQNSPLHQALLCVAKSKRWNKYTGSCDQALNYRSAAYYYGIISKISRRVELWETTYIHVLDGHQALLEWYKSTGMRPYLNALPDDAARAQFEDEVLTICKKEYSVRQNGKVLYPFSRVFFIAYKTYQQPS